MEQSTTFVFVGTYTRVGPQPKGRADGVYVYRFDGESGALTFVGLAEDVPNPSFVALHPNGETLYVVNETWELDEQSSGAVSAFALDRETGALTFLNRQPSHGTDPCHLSLDQLGSYLLAANYTSGSVAVLPVEADGSLAPATDVRQHEGSGPNTARQEGPHAHFITPDPEYRYVLVADLGQDQVIVYRLGSHDGTLSFHSSVKLPAGAGPRHLAFHPAGSFVYVINELDSTISTCAWDGDAGTLELLETVSTLPDDFTGSNTCAQILVDPSGRTVYGSNRGHHSIASFAVDPERGTLTPTGHTPTGGETPRNFAIDRAGRFLLAANQHTDTIVTFQIDSETGALSATGHVTQVPSPVCILIGD